MRFLCSVLGLLLLAGGIPAHAGPSDGSSSASERPSAFGIRANDYSVHRARVSRYQTFADLLTPHGVSYRQAVQLAQAVRPAFDVRDIRTGQPYQVYVNPWLQQAQYLVYQIDDIRYVVFNVQHPSRSQVGRRPVRREWRVLQGDISSSLYETLIENDAHPQLALRLSNIFAWEVDFFRIRSGDSFRILYERRTVNGERVTPGKILAASFDHRDTRHYGFRFDNGQGPSYFDRQGRNLQRRLLRAPLRYTRISTRFSRSRYDPVLDRRRPHLGTDYVAPVGTPVHSVGDGTVVKAGYQEDDGNSVKIRHGEVYASSYLHLASIANGVTPDATVQQGETIGYVGTSGMSTGPHLNYRLWKNGEAVDPYALELPPAPPVSPPRLMAFRRLVRDRLDRLYPFQSFGRRPIAWTRTIEARPDFGPVPTVPDELALPAEPAPSAEPRPTG